MPALGSHTAFIQPVRGTPDPGVNGAAVGLQVDETIDRVDASLSACGVVFRGPVDEEGALGLAFFTDPDGNELYLAELSR